jgi:Asp-tRNA(Asn)/Glu-tRNA(Gln) amidotransferase A subunit family amidase
MAVIGPLGASTRDLILFMKVVLDQEPWKINPTLIPLPWREVQLSKNNLTVGIMYDDGRAKPAPPIIRALKECAAKLQKSGVKVIEWEPYEHRRGYEIVCSMYFADGGKEDLDVMAATGEPSMPLSDFVLKGIYPSEIQG